MAFNGTEGEFINLNEAGDMTKAWRDSDCGPANAVFFGREKLEEILAQEGTMGIRMYFAVNDKDEKTLVLVGAESDENDQTNGRILDKGITCPVVCSSPNAINS